MGIPTQRNDDGKLVTSGAATAHLRDEATTTLSAPLIELSPAATRVIDALATAGGRPLLVGGSVRDALLADIEGRAIAPKDIDIEVHGFHGHEQIIAALRRLGRVDERGVAFGIVAATVDGEDFDISLPRTERKTGDGHRGFTVEVAPELDEMTAFGRRDFTVNAIGWDPVSEDLIDPYNGAADLRDGVLRHTTEAFAEDPLRVLRGAQFSARFGFTLAEETIALSADISDRYRELSVERVWGEWRKIARAGTHVTAALDVLRSTTWLRHFPDLAATVGVEQDPHWHPEGDVFTHLGLAADAAAANAVRDHLNADDREVAVLAALVHDFGKTTSSQRDGDRITSHGHAEEGEEPAARFLTGIGAPHHIVDRVRPLVRRHMAHAAVSGTPSKTAVRRLMRHLGEGNSGTTIHDWARLVDADCAGRGPGAKPSPAPAWLEIAVLEKERMKPILTGGHLIGLGWTPGPHFGPVLNDALAAQDAGEFIDEAEALGWLTAHHPQKQ